MSFNMSLLSGKLLKINSFLWGAPIILIVLSIGLVGSLCFNFLQISYFFKGWVWTFSPEKSDRKDIVAISPFQAFMNALSTSMGNGGLVGMAVVFVDGGLGSIFWIFILGILGMIIRFLEVYSSIKMSTEKLLGPLGYISKLPLGKFFCNIYAISLLVFGLLGAVTLQVNAIGMTLEKSLGACPYRIGLGFMIFVAYVVFGGAKKIMKLTEIIVPIKVALFFIGIFSLLGYHSVNIIPVLQEGFNSAFTLGSFYKGAFCYAVQRIISVSWSRTISATETGLGLSGIFFSAASTSRPLKTAIMSMITSFIAINLVCVLTVLALSVSGVPRDGIVIGAPLLVDAFSTVMGRYGGSFMILLSFSFGIGVLISYIFSGLKIWESVFGNKTLIIYRISAVILAFVGAIISVKSLFGLLDFLSAILVIINILALLWSLPTIYYFFKKDIQSIES